MRKTALQYGLWMLAGFIGFFLVMHLAGLSANTYLRIFNGFFHFGLMWAAIRRYREEHPESIDNYVSGVAMGIWTSAVGVLGFVIFMFLFFVVEPSFLQQIKDNTPLGKYLNPATATLFILVEGISVSLIGAYIATRLVDMRLTKSSSYRNRAGKP